MTIITSKSNNLIKKTKKLLKNKHRVHSYLIEGWHLFEEARKAGAHFLNIFVLKEYAHCFEHFSKVTVVTVEVLKELTDSKTPQGIIAEISLVHIPLKDVVAGKYLVLEDVQDPGNVGTMIRTADAAGLDGVFISEKTADIYNQKTLRSMQGSHFHLPIWRTDISDICHQLQKSSIPLIATTLSKESINFNSLESLPYFAVIMGNEGKGISKKIMDSADILTHINMPGQAESLNVSVATGIILFHLIS